MIFQSIAKSGFLVKFEGFGEFYFTEKSGGKISASSSEVPNGSGNSIFQISGPTKVENITLKAPYDPGLVGQIEPLILAFSCKGYDLTITPVDCKGTIGSTPQGTSTVIAGLPLDVVATPTGASYVYSNSRVISYNPPEVDRKSGDYAMIEIEFISDAMRRGTTYTGSGAGITGGLDQDILQGLSRFLN